MNTQIRKKIADCLKEQSDVMNEDYSFINRRLLLYAAGRRK